MDTFRKWLNKPKADDKSLLARFYHADRSLAAVASELDSFDGRSEPDRCSRLVSRLRQSQDKVLFITNLIMDELLGDDRDPRSFRAKFPEEVLQENLGGQLWFGAECLAAGSSIMNREQESKDMRPLAQAVTKSLGNVRNLLRDQCLRNNVPNSRTLHLNLNDSSTEQLCESLKIFDRLFAEFELRYVSAMVQVKTKHEYEMQELICVLFSETLQRALSIGLLEQDKVDSFDPELMFSIPRLAIISGLVIYHRGPLNMDMAADQLSEMFRPFRTILVKIRNLLRSLNKNELHQLERLLCTNEDIHLKVEVGSSSIEAPPSPDQQNNNEGSKSGCTKTSQNSNYDDTRHSFSGDNGGPNKTMKSTLKDNNPTPSSGNAVHQAASSSSSHKRVLQSTSNATHSIKTACTVLGAPTCSPVFSVSAESSATSTPTVSPVASPTPSHSIASISSVVSISTTSATEWTDDDEDNASDADEDEELPKELDIVSADCASGYLIPNTNFGNLLQPQEVPLTDNFVASEDEFAGNQTDAEHTSATLTSLPSTSTVSTHNCTTSTHTYSSETSEQFTTKASSNSERSMASKSDGSSRSTSSCSCSRRQECQQHQQESSSNNIASDEMVRRHHHHHAHRHHHHRHHHHHHHHRHQHSKSTRSTVVGEREDELNQHTTAKGGLKKSHTSKHWVSKHSSIEDISSADSTSASLSDGDPHEVSMALRAAGRHKFKSTENLLHRLFVCIAGVADQLQTNFASDLRQILRSVFMMNMSSSQEEPLDIPEKTKESEFFEFRASENDVIQESAGSNQSIYSAEEVNPELDNVFNNSGSAAVIQRIHTIDLADNSQATVAANMRNTLGRSRSLGDQHETETGTSSSSSNSNNNNNNHARNLSSYITGGRLSSPSRQPAMLQRHRNRNNSVGTNSSASSSSSSSSSSPSSSSSSESNSPVSERVSTCFPPTNNCSQSSANSVTANNNNSAVEEGPTVGFLTSPSTQSQSLRLAPPAWIPDEKAPRCMSCHTPFTAFRRRHHCRNCGGVFCGVCSNASAPLPKYGLTKAVRMCRECYMREIRSVSSMRNNAPPRAAASMQHPTAAAIVGS